MYDMLTLHPMKHQFKPEEPRLVAHWRQPERRLTFHRYFVDAIEAPHTFEQLRTAAIGHILKPLIVALLETSQPSHLVTALLSAVSLLLIVGSHTDYFQYTRMALHIYRR